MLKIALFGPGLPAWAQPFRFLVAVFALSWVIGSTVVASDWQVLFDGASLECWKPSRENKQFKLVDGVILGSSSDQTRFLHTTKEFSNFELELEVKLHDPDLNSGVQIRTLLTRSNEKGESRAVVHGPQVDLGKSPGRSGYLFGQGNKGWITPKDDLSRHSLMKNGEWNRVRVLAIGPKIQTWINGQKVTDLVVSEEIQKQYSKGVIALQVHGVKKSPEKVRHVSFRSIRVREIDSERKPEH